MKNVLLKFYVDMNLGDDMMIHQLLKRFPDYKFHVVSRKDTELDVFLQYPNFHLLHRKGRQKFDAYVLVGGSVLNYNNLSGLLYQVKEILRCAILKLKGVKTMVIGANLSDIPGKWYKGLYKAVLFVRIKLLNLITLRDDYSYNIIEPMSKNNVYRFPDIVFGYPYKRALPREATGTLGISVFCNRFEFKDDASVYRKLAQIANQYLRDSARRILLFAFDTGQLNDCRGMLQVYRMIENKQQAEMVMYYGDADAFIGKIDLCDYFLPVRFHSLVLSLKLGIPFLPFIYSSKTANLLSDIGYTGARFSLSDLSAMDAGALINEACFTQRKGFVLNQDQLEDLETKAAGHYDMLEKVLQAQR
ncbi:MAG: polysaccharide pyruvyl transferase family protein [Christensenellales bacterium]